MVALTINNSLLAQQIRDGIRLREEGNYQEGLKTLLSAFDQSLELEDPKLATEAGNQTSIQYRLLAGRTGRDGDQELARQYSNN
jgi:hypothetical protein